MKEFMDAKEAAAFDRCMDVMCRLIQKYGHKVLAEQNMAKDEENKINQLQSGEKIKAA